MILFHASLVVILLICGILAYLFIKGATQAYPDWLSEAEYQNLKEVLDNLEKEAETDLLKRNLGIGPYFVPEEKS
jgi:hypothetical protein